MKIMKFAALLAVLGFAIAHPAMATTYAVNDQECCGSGATVVGSITTDSKLGTLAMPDIADWTLTINTLVTLTPANSSVTLTGTHLSATPTALLFNYDPAPADITPYTFSFLGNVDNVDASVSYSTAFFSFDIGMCDVGDMCFISLGEHRSGVGVIAGTADSTTPLPTALPLFATGLGALSLLGWRRKKKSTALAA